MFWLGFFYFKSKLLSLLMTLIDSGFNFTKIFIGNFIFFLFSVEIDQEDLGCFINDHPMSKHISVTHNVR